MRNTVDEKIKILFLASDPKDIHPVKLDTELRAIDKHIQVGLHRRRQSDPRQSLGRRLFDGRARNREGSRNLTPGL